ncbi:MAG: hypothetical protein LN412_05255 [Candidatus Thermoplasmatota archaeon]|nr:hypothetical protein [Candidatus Thermoplasmatota archaeon]
MARTILEQDTVNLIRLCELRLKRDPHDPDALFAKAAVLAGLGLFSDALDYLSKVSSKIDDYPGLVRFRERVLVEMDQYFGLRSVPSR